MKKQIAIVMASAALMFAAGKQTFTGTITDSMCGGDHKAMNMGSDDKCVTECVKMGAKYALCDGKNGYVLSDQKTPAKFAAKKVTVMGTLDGEDDQGGLDRGGEIGARGRGGPGGTLLSRPFFAGNKLWIGGSDLDILLHQCVFAAGCFERATQ